MSPTDATAILRRLDAARSLQDKADVLRGLMATVPVCAAHPTARHYCLRCWQSKGGRALTPAKLKQLRDASRVRARKAKAAAKVRRRLQAEEAERLRRPAAAVG